MTNKPPFFRGPGMGRPRPLVDSQIANLAKKSRTVKQAASSQKTIFIEGARPSAAPLAATGSLQISALSPSGLAAGGTGDAGSTGQVSDAGHVHAMPLTYPPSAHAATHASAGGDPLSLDTSQITTGTLADARLPNIGSAGTVGDSSHYPIVTTDAKGRVTGMTTQAVSSGLTPTKVGQIQYSVDGATWGAYLPMFDNAGNIMSDNAGHLIVT